MGREPESTAVELRKVAIHLQCSLTLDLARNRNLLRQLASRIKIMIKIKKLANALNSMVVEPERGAERKTNLLSPALSSLWGREGEVEISSLNRAWIRFASNPWSFPLLLGATERFPAAPFRVVCSPASRLRILAQEFPASLMQLGIVAPRLEAIAQRQARMPTATLSGGRMTEFFVQSGRYLLPLLLRHEGGEGWGEEADFSPFSWVFPSP